MQVVGYEPTPEPALRVAAAAAVERVPLTPGRSLEYRLGARRCAGRIVEGDRHEPCSNPGVPRCEAHTVPWSIASNADSDERHAVYLAAFAPDTFKVGVTRTWRLGTRLREQGADRAAHVYTEPDGRAARGTEADIAAGDHPPGPVPDRVRVTTKIRGLGRSVDADAWEALLAGVDVHERFVFEYGLDLAGDPTPVAETVARGTVRGVKGRVLVVETGGTTYAVDLRDLVGHEISTDAPGRARQSSLDAFR